ncbi:vesicle-fusing ATPase 1-like protein [Leptotrombidium deliense]|uniref:Vesicle-fusing ATPase 1-like protein n=1 Tax=Leptotrombidium deliense TaxID=299467 RepID=A0A443RX47_9ACAR|nr:vesicle-fusing ATPase 1-like protein [Leptotrombidium deliense]
MTKPPPDDNKLLILCTTSCKRMCEELDILSVFTTVFNVPNLTEIEHLKNVLQYLSEKSTSFESESNDSDPLSEKSFLFENESKDCDYLSDDERSSLSAENIASKYFTPDQYTEIVNLIEGIKLILHENKIHDSDHLSDEEKSAASSENTASKYFTCTAESP